MGRRARETDETAEEITPVEETMPENLADFFQQFGDEDLSVNVQKLNDQKGTWEHVHGYTLNEFNIDVLADNFGGGKYRINIIDADKRWKKRTTVIIANRTPVKQVDTRPQENEMVAVLRGELAAAKEQEKSITVAMIGMMSQVLTAQQQNRGSSEKTTVDELIKMKSLLSENRNPMNEISSIIDFLKTGITMGKEFGAVSADRPVEDVLISKLIDNFGDKIPAIIAGLSKLGTGAPAAQRPAALPQEPLRNIPLINIPMQAGGSSMDYKDLNEKNVIETIRGNLAQLLQAAKFGVSTVTVADSIEHQLPETDMMALVDYISIDENIPRLFAFIPEFREYKNFADALIANLREYEIVDEPAVAVIPPQDPIVKPE